MKPFRKLLLVIIALGGFSFVTSAQAHWCHRPYYGYGYRPYYGYYHPYYAGYYAAPYYYHPYGVTIAFGGGYHHLRRFWG